MGQRLVLTVTQNGEDIAKIYYHWSAYSISALQEAKNIIDVLYDDTNKIKDLKLRLIKFLEQNGGGIDGGEGSSEWKYIKQLYPKETFKKDGISRNQGLIALSEDGMESMQSWSEGDVYIDLDTDMVTNYVNYTCESIDSYNKDRKEWDEDFEPLTFNDIPVIEYDLTDFSVDDIDYVIMGLESFDGYVCRYKNQIYELIA